MLNSKNKLSKLFCPACNYISNVSADKKNKLLRCEVCNHESLVAIPSNRIVTETPEDALWYSLRKLKYKGYLTEVIRKRINGNFRQFDSSGYKCVTLDDIGKQTELVTMALLQAEEYYKHANSTNIAVSPVLYLYGMINLVKALLASTYQLKSYEKDIKRHGIINSGGLNLNEGINIAENGEFQGFFKCASVRAKLHLEQLKNCKRFISIEQLFSSVPMFRSDFKSSNKLPHWPFSIVIFLMIFKLASVCRYEPKIWYEFMNGNIGEHSYLFEKVIQFARTRFPEWILILMTGENYEIRSAAFFEARHDRYETY